jgi:hypothetical protein
MLGTFRYVLALMVTLSRLCLPVPVAMGLLALAVVTARMGWLGSIVFIHLVALLVYYLVDNNVNRIRDRVRGQKCLALETGKL